MTMTSQFVDMTSSSIFFDVVLFLLSSLVTDPSFMSISSLVLELWQFSFIRDWPEIRKSEIPPSEFCPISGDWSKLGIPKFGINVSSEMLLNAAKCQGYSFYCFWVIKGKPTAGEGKGDYPPSPTQIRVKAIILYSVHSISFVKYVFSPMIRFMKTSTRIMKYESQVVKSNFMIFKNTKLLGSTTNR